MRSSTRPTCVHISRPAPRVPAAPTPGPPSGRLAVPAGERAGLADRHDVGAAPDRDARGRAHRATVRPSCTRWRSGARCCERRGSPRCRRSGAGTGDSRSPGREAPDPPRALILFD